MTPAQKAIALVIFFLIMKNVVGSPVQANKTGVEGPKPRNGSFNLTTLFDTVTVEFGEEFGNETLGEKSPERNAAKLLYQNSNVFLQKLVNLVEEFKHGNEDVMKKLKRQEMLYQNKTIFEPKLPSCLRFIDDTEYVFINIYTGFYAEDEIYYANMTTLIPPITQEDESTIDLVLTVKRLPYFESKDYGKDIHVYLARPFNVVDESHRETYRQILVTKMFDDQLPDPNKRAVTLKRLLKIDESEENLKIQIKHAVDLLNRNSANLILEVNRRRKQV